uniref:Uncharacterized protein n=1 Tax=Oryza glumipatula TaxID=40148 RepID=A0A0D9Z7K1_9ORYZ
MASSSASPRLSSAPAAAATFAICCAASAAFVDASGRVAEKNALVIAATTGADDINRPFLVRLLSEIGLGVGVEDNRKRRSAKTRREDWAGNRRGRQLRGGGRQRSICDTPILCANACNAGRRPDDPEAGLYSAWCRGDDSQVDPALDMAQGRGTWSAQICCHSIDRVICDAIT